MGDQTRNKIIVFLIKFILNFIMLFIFCLMMTPAMVMSMEDEEFEFLEPLPDYYAMLNVSHDASMKQIKRSFRKLAMDFHPDKNKTDGAQIVFQELSEAYSILSDPLKKIEYDQLFQDFFDMAQAFEAAQSDGDADPFDASDINDADEQEFTDQENKEKDVFEETNSHDKNGNYYSQPSSEPTPDKSEESEDTDEAGDEEFDLDDETLYKVLKFLADNDYVITKRTRKTPVNRGQNFRDENGKFSGYGGYRSYEYIGHPGATGGHFGTPRGPSGAPRSHQGHDHPWTASHQHKPRSGERPAHYSAQFHGSEQVYCKVSTSWEGQVKVTTRTCY